MITTNRVILTTTNKLNLDIFLKHEAITLIKTHEEAVKVFRNNKTPILFLNNDDSLDVSHLKVPDLSGDLIEISEQFIDFCHENGIESGEYISGVKFNSNSERCVLCELASCKGMNGDLAFYNKNVEKPVDCIIYDSRFFYVVPELGALKQGFLMIVPKSHYLSVAQYPAQVLKEYQEVCEDIESILLSAFNAKLVTFFEHGSAPDGITSHKKSIVHAHTHVVTDFHMDKIYQDMVRLKPIDDITDAKNTYYFSYQEGSHGNLKISMDSDVYVQRQYPRQVLAEHLGLAPGQYNWRKAAFDEISTATVYRLYSYLKNLPSGRISDRTHDFVEGYSMRDAY